VATVTAGVVGGNGSNAGSTLILFTRDAGERWEVATISGGNNPALRNSVVQDACFLEDSGGAMAVGFGVSGSVLLRSSDGGESWSDITELVERLPDQPHGVACVDSSLVWVVGGGSASVIHSEDGGDTWIDQTDNTPSLPGEVLAVAFLDADRGIAGGVGPFVIDTGDGGNSWTRDDLRLSIGGGLHSINARSAQSGGCDAFAAVERASARKRVKNSSISPCSSTSGFTTGISAGRSRNGGTAGGS
jgi:photosystem II stability/assembly factor-like uncharacterized protein